MYKVDISPDGIVTSNNELIGQIKQYQSTEYSKYPNTIHNLLLTNVNGGKMVITFGGYKDDKFIECCHLKCKWGYSCMNYARCNCIYNTKIQNKGVYIL